MTARCGRLQPLATVGCPLSPRYAPELLFDDATLDPGATGAERRAPGELSSLAVDDTRGSLWSRGLARGHIQFSLDEAAAPRLELSIEPWGEDYTLRAGKQIKVVAETESVEPPRFHVHVHQPGVFMVFIEGPVVAFQVFEDGVPVNCGHGR